MKEVEITATPQELWEPAKPGETLDNIWIPNRRERRQMLKGQKKAKNKQQRFIGKLFQKAEKTAKENPDYRKEIYKALYENLQKMTENIEEELEQKNQEENIKDGTTERD